MLTKAMISSTEKKPPKVNFNIGSNSTIVFNIDFCESIPH